jgi:hypothetical protein
MPRMFNCRWRSSFVGSSVDGRPCTELRVELTMLTKE